MGRNNKAYYKDLKQQMHDVLTAMLDAGVGTSKKEAMKKNDIQDKIYSYNTYKTYWKHLKYFANYIKIEHPECTTLKAAKKYAGEWLQHRVDQVDEKGEHLSAWTIQTEAKAINKLFGITPDDKEYFTPPKRERKNIKRSRGVAVRDKNFSELNNYEFVQFCKNTGCRRNVLEKLLGRDLYSKEEMEERVAFLKEATITEPERKELELMSEALEYFPEFEYFIHHVKDKGGRERWVPVLKDGQEAIVRRMRSIAPDARVWLVVSENADVHGYRADYATAIYKKYARNLDEIPYDMINKGTGRKYQSGIYTCRKDEVGKKLDKIAMEKASKALGHNRLEIIANNYLRGL